MSLTDYEEFIASKRIASKPSGFTVDRDTLHSALFEYQRDIVTWALRRGRAALFEHTGMGKTLQQLVWGDEVSKFTNGGMGLLLAPLAVTHQTQQEADRWGITAREVTKQSECGSGINITNYDKLDRFDPSMFAGVIIDECFAADTLIDCLELGVKTQKYIKDIRKGDIILNAAGVDTVADIHRREVPYGVRVTTSTGSFIASPNHPVFTQRGWVGAQHLRPGDYALGTEAALSVVCDGVLSEVSGAKSPEVLRDILLSEMAYESPSAQSESSYAGNTREDWAQSIGVVSIRERGIYTPDGENYCSEPNIRPGGVCEDLPPIERDRPQTFRTWWQREANASASGILDGVIDRRMDSGICLINGQTGSRLAVALQVGHSEPETEDMHRGGWVIAHTNEEETVGSTQRRIHGIVRVDGIEVLKQGHPDLERYRDADGKLYFYDIGATRHPSFSVNGILVHNSSRLKSYDGAFRNFVISAFANCPFRLACTATPAPNDYMELGNHAEFLGIMTRTEMLATFFTHDGGDTSKWILKGHAEEAFWKWVCTWAVMIQKPSDLGYSDDGFELPPLHIHHRTVERDDAIPDDGALFQLEARTLQERQRERKLSTTDRVGACAEIVLESDEQCIVWCDRNGEQDAIAKILGNRCVSIHGHGMTDDDKVRLYEQWKSGTVPYMVVKGIMFGFGLNMQQCHRMVFLGLSDSWEQYFQAIRRCWRFGQAHAVDSYVVTSSLEGAVVANIERKEQEASEMAARMIEHMRAEMEREIRSCDREEEEYAPALPMVIPSWLLSRSKNCEPR